MLAVGSAILLGAALLLAFAFLKLVSDIKCRAIASARQSFEDHFGHVNRFIEDPAAPVALSKVLVTFSTYINEERAGKKVLELIISDHSSEAGSTKPLDSSMIALGKSLDELAGHRSDLAESFRKAVTCGFLGAAYSQVAREMSPVRAFQENQEARQAKRSNRSNESMARTLGALLGPISPTPA